MNINEAIAKRILNLLQKNNKTQYRLGIDSGISHTTISSIMTAQVKTSKLSTIAQIAWTFGLSISEFFNDPMFDEDNLLLID